MSDVNANIRVHVDTQQAAASLAALQQQIATLNASMVRQKTGQMGDMGLGKVIPDLKNAQVEIKNVASATAVLDKQLAGMKAGFGKSFGVFQRSLRGVGTEMQLATQKAEIMNDVYYKLGTNAAGSMTTVARAAGAAATRMEVFQQQMVIGARALDQMGTAALNWGKNMQWAGRQLMVGFTVPLTIFSGLAVKAFMDVERAFVNFQRVYGDFTTSTAETERMTDSIRELSIEMSKLGFTAQETIELAGKAAATGTVGDALIQQVEQASKLASLGQISQEAALDTIISLSTAFGIQSEKLGETVDFLNAVENQTVLALEDVAEAIPLVAPVIQGLGGDVRDLAVMLTAMREGGINANEGANALKTSLARLITPTKQATETAAQFGINLDNIVQNNAGDLMGMIDQLAMAMEGLSELQKQQLLSDVFGKRQFARMGTMFANISKEGSQAARTMELVNAEASDLAALSEKELSAVRESATMQFKSALETFQLAIAPIGEMVLKIITPLLEFGTRVANAFNNLSDGAKQFGVIFAAAIGVIIPAGLMLTGLVGNLVGNLINGVAKLMRFAAGAKFATNQEMEMALATNTLNDAQGRLANMLVGSNDAMATQALMLQRLQREYAAYAAQINASPATARGAFAPRQPLRFATGGKVPGTGNKDTIPALLTPGEMVINKAASQKHGAVLKAINNGSVGMYAKGKVDSVGSVSLQKGSFQSTKFVSGRGQSYDFSQYAGMNDKSREKVATLIDRLESWGHSQDDIVKALDVVSVDMSDGVKKLTSPTSWGDKFREDPRTQGLYESGQTRYLAGQTERSHMEGRGAGAHQEMSAQNLTLYADKSADIKLASDANRILSATNQSTAFQGRALGNMVLNEDKLVNQLLRSGEKGTGQGWAGGSDILKALESSTASEKTAVQMWQAQQMTNLDSLDDAQKGLVQAYDVYKQKVAAIDPNDIIVETMDNNPKAEAELARRKAAGIDAKAVVLGDLYDDALREVGETNTSLRQWHQNIENSSGGFRMQGSISQETVDVMNDHLANMTETERISRGLPKKFDIIAADKDGRKALQGTYDNGKSSRFLLGSQAQSSWAGDSPWHWTKGPQSYSRPRKGADVYGERMMGESLKARTTAIQAELKLMGEQLELTAKEAGSQVYRSLETAMSTEMQAGRLSATLKEHVMEAIAMTDGQARDDAMRLGGNLIAALDPRTNPDDRNAAIVAWQNFGKDIGLGLTGGMKSMKVPAGKEAQALGLWINNEFKRVEGIASPSKVWRRFGEMLADGLTLGLRSKKPQLAAAGAEAAQATNQGYQSFAYTAEESEAARRALGMGPIVNLESLDKRKPKRLDKFSGIGKGLQKGTAKIGGAGAGGALMMGSMLPMMMADEQGKIAGKVDSSVVMSGMMVAGMFQTMIPMLSGLSAGLLGLIGVVGGVAAALGLAAFAIYKWRDGVDKASRSAAEAGANLSSFGKNISTMNAVLGTSSLTEQAASMKVRTEADKINAAERFGSQLESEEGQQMLDELKELNSSDREKQLSGMVESAVQSGSLSKEDAATFAKEVGLRIGDESAGMKAAANAMKAVEGSANMLAAANEDAANISKDSAYQAAEAANDNTIGYRDASRAIGIATAGLKNYNEVIAKAELEYYDGIISYKDYIKILNEARAAQSDYNKVILNAVNNSSDKGAAIQGLKRAAEITASPEEIEKVQKSIDFDVSQGIFGLGGSQGTVKGGSTRSSFVAGYMNTQIETNPDYDLLQKATDEQIEVMNNKREADVALTKYETQLAKQYDALSDEAELAISATKDLHPRVEAAGFAWLASGESAEEIATILSYIKQNPMGNAGKQLASGEFDFETISAEVRLETMDNGQQIRNLFSDYSPGEGTVISNPDELLTILNYLDQIQNKEEQMAEARRLASIGYEQAGVEAAAKAYGIDDNLIDTEMVKENGMEAIAAIEEVMSSADLSPVQQDFLFQTLINGSVTDPQELLSLMEKITMQASRLKTVPSDILLSLGIDPDNPKDQQRYGTQEEVDKMLFADTMMNESLPEEVDRTYVSKFIMMDGSGNILSPDEMSKNLVQVKKAWNKFSKKDDKTEGDIVDYAIKVMPRVTVTDENGDQKEVGNKEGAQAAYDMINDAIGLDKFNTLDLGTQQAILNLAISTNLEGADDAARALYIKERLASEGVTYAEAVGLAEEAAAIEQRNKEREQASARMKAMANGNGPSGSSSGSSGGGGDDKDWFEQLDEDAKWATQMYGRLTAGEKQKSVAKIGWIEWLRRNTDLSEEAIQAIVEDEEAMERLRKKKGKDAKVDFANKYAEKDNKKYLKERRDEGRAQKRQNEQTDALFATEGRNRVTEFIAEDPQMLAAYQTNPKKTLKVAREIVAANTTQLDLVEDRIAREELLFEAQQARLNLLIAEQEYAFNIANIPLQERNVTLNAQIASLQASGVDPIREKIKEQQYLIKQIEREYIINQKNLEKYQDQTEELQRRVSDMRRALDLRQREGQLLDHDLKLMSWAEQDINEAYEERIEALDKVREINEAIANSQKDQLGLADALSRGDIGAAALAAQQMQQNQMQFASEQARYQLERAKDNAIDTLTGAESGMTREQIEDRQRELEEDSYYTNLQIRDLEDQIYDLSIKIRNENDIIDGFKDKIQKKNELIRDLEWDILNFERDKIWPLEQQVAANDRIIKQNDAEKLQLTETARIDLAYSDERKKLADARNAAELVGLKIQEAMGESIRVTTRELRDATEQANQFWRGIKKGTGQAVKLSKVPIPKLSDTLASDVAAAANFTIDVAKPFEEIVAANSTYNIPTAAVSSGATSGIMSSVTNNYNSVNNVTINAAGQPVDANMLSRTLKFASEGQVG